MIQQACVEGIATRRADDLIKARGCDGISKSQLSCIRQELDGVVESFLPGLWMTTPIPTSGWMP